MYIFIYIVLYMYCVNIDVIIITDFKIFTLTILIFVTEIVSLYIIF